VVDGGGNDGGKGSDEKGQERERQTSGGVSQ